MKRFLIVIGVVVIFLVCISFFRDLIIKSVVISTASSVTGAPVHIDGFSMNIFTSTIHITGFRMDNPSGFPDGMLVSCPKIKVIFDRASLFNYQPHFLLIDVDLKEMVLTKNKEGKLNVDSLKMVHPSTTSTPVPLKIDLLNLSIGEIVYKDYTVGVNPSVRAFEVNRHQSYKRVPTAQQLALLVLSQPMKAAAIKDAEIYGVVALAGVAMLPVAVVATFTAKDSVEQIIDASFEKVYTKSLEQLKLMGTITDQDVSSGVIKANVHGSKVALKLKKTDNNKTKITISARKYLLPQPDIAGGVLFQILQKL